MTSPINSTSQLSGASSATSTAAATASTPTMGANDFLKLLMAQLQNQDPLQPTDGTEFVTQLAQFSQVQQSQTQTTTLATISTQLQGMSNSNASDLVGKTVTIQNTSMQWNGTYATSASVTLGGAAQQVTATVQDSQGNTVRTMNVGASPAGPLTITWNGATDAGQAAPSGTYSVNVTAAGANGQSVNVSQTVSGVVSQVSYNQGYPALALSSGAVAPVSQLVSVGATPTTP
jgi:flagellar basal-body rod modification protein FlgD